MVLIILRSGHVARWHDNISAGVHVLHKHLYYKAENNTALLIRGDLKIEVVLCVLLKSCEIILYLLNIIPVMVLCHYGIVRFLKR